MALQIYAATSSVQGFPFLHVLANAQSFFLTAILKAYIKQKRIIWLYNRFIGSLQHLNSYYPDLCRESS